MHLWRGESEGGGNQYTGEGAGRGEERGRGTSTARRTLKHRRLMCTSARCTHVLRAFSMTGLLCCSWLGGGAGGAASTDDGASASASSASWRAETAGAGTTAGAGGKGSRAIGCATGRSEADGMAAGAWGEGAGVPVRVVSATSGQADQRGRRRRPAPSRTRILRHCVHCAVSIGSALTLHDGTEPQLVGAAAAPVGMMGRRKREEKKKKRKVHRSCPSEQNTRHLPTRSRRATPKTERR
jgi:hypothetical protein